MGEKCRVCASLLAPSPQCRSGHEVLWDNPTAFAHRARGVQQPHDPTCSVRTEVARRWAPASPQNSAGSSPESRRAADSGQITWLTLMEEDQPGLAGITFPIQVFLVLDGSREPGRAAAAQSPTRRRSLFQHRLQIAKQLSGLMSSAQRTYCAADLGKRSWPPAIPSAAGRQRDAGGA